MSGDGARVYYGYKADADYSKERLLIKVTYYKTKADALKGGNDGVDPLGKFVRVEYTSNNPEDANQQPDKWALRPTWWFGVPNGLKADTISQIRLVRNERGTQEASSPATPGAKKLKDASRQGYVVASDHTYNSIDQWKHSVSRDYYSGSDKTIDGKGWQRMVGITKNEKDYDNSGNTKGQWDIYKDGNANGLQGIFADWESAGQRYYEMSYVAEMTDDAWKQRDQKPLLFVAGIYRGVGKWRYAAGTTMRAPKIADNLELKYPKPTPVKDLSSLDENEQKAVKKAIEDVNKSADTKNPNLFDKLVAKDGISVDAKGNATITFTDNTKRIMPANLLVLKNETDKDKYKPTLPARTPVVKLKNLTTKEKTAVTQAIINANGGSEPNAFLQHVKKTSNQYEIRVQEDGSAKVTYADGSELTIPSTDLVYQGATIADWAPYILPGYTEVGNPSSLTQKEITDLIAKFDKANEKLGIYNAAKQNGKSPVSIATNGTATITWKDGSQTIVPGFLYLKKKAPDAPKTKPTGDEKKYFTVAVPTNISSVNFDPFNMKATDLTDQANSAQLTSIKDTLKALTATDTKDSNTHPQITGVTFAVDKNGVGKVTFTADKYESATYPMGMFMKQKPELQKHQQSGTVEESGIKYNLNKYFVDDPEHLTTEDKNGALLQFVKDNYKSAGTLTGSKCLVSDLTPKDSTKGLKASVNASDGVVDIEYNDSGDIVIKGYKTTGSSTKLTELLTIDHSRIYEKRKKETVTPQPSQDGYQYNLTKIGIAGETPTQDEVKHALQQFVNDNYTGTIPAMSDGTVTLENASGVNAAANTKGMTPYSDATGAGVTKIFANTSAIMGDYGDIIVLGHKNGDTEDDASGASLEEELFTIKASDLYIKNSGSQTPTDNTVEKLKALAKQLLKEKEKLTKSDFTRAGLDKDKITDDAINKMTDAEELRELIKKLSEAKHADRTYNSAGDVVVDDPTKPTKEDFEKAVEAFVKANYANSDNFNANAVTTTLPTDLTPKSGTVNMEIADDNIMSVTSSKTGNDADYKSMVFKDKNGKELFSVAISYKKKEETPKLSDAELKEMRKQAKETIDRNPNLTKTDKKGFDDRIDTANTAEDIQKILKEAAEKANQNSTSNDPKVKGEISGNQNGTDAQNQKNLDAAKEAAKQAIDALTHLSNEKKKEFKDKLNGDTVKTPADVQNIVNAAKLADELKGVKEEAQKATFVFLDHGTGDDKHNTADTHAEDAALNELLHGTPAKDPTLAALEAALAKQDATADEIKNALDAAKLQNTSNEQNAKNAGIAKLDAKKAELDAAYKALPSKQQESAKTSYEAATKAIDDAKTAVNNATKPSEIKKAVDGVDTKIDAANGDIKKNTPKRDTSNITNDQNSELNKEKEAQKKRINGSDLPDAEKQKAIKDIEAATMLGDPTGIANRYLKAQKIEDAKKQIAALEYLNKAQKQYYKDLLDSTDASDHVDEAGKPTGKDDIDDALEQALNLNGVMKRLADLATSADELKKDDKDKKYSSADNDKKSAFDAALKAANTQLDKVDGADSDNINADGANALYGKLLEAMKALDNTVKDVDLYTSDLQKEYKADLALKEKPVYKNATKNVKEAFDKALAAAEDAIADAEGNKKLVAGEDPKTQEQKQKAVDAALTALQNAAKALDGKEQKPTPAPSVDKSGLKALVDAAGQVKDSDAYKYADANKQGAYDKAISDGQSMLAKTDATADEVANAVNAINTAKTALDGKKPTPTPTPEPAPTPTPSVDKSHLQQGINGSGDVKKSDDYNNAPSDKKQAYDHALDHANEVNKDPNATQDQVNQAAEDLKKAENDLKPTPTPTPTPSPLPTPGAGTGAGTGNAGSGSEAGYGVNDNAPTTVDKGELNIQIDSAESDLQPGNAGNGNAGSNNAGNAANAGANAGNAGNAGAANANAGSAPNAQGDAGAQGAGAGTGTTGAANAGVDNKAVNNAVENSPEVKQADAAVKQAAAMLDEALTQAKRVAADPHATQAQVDAAAVKLADARKAFADAQANAAKVRAAVRSRVIKGMRSRGNAGIATGANVVTTGLMATMIAAIGGAFVTRRMRAKHANRD
ncbi:hypothetical protein ACLD5S_02975 [Gardnerella vaginalis]|uniref:hypothetical protein n=1 Tax=Gardnerella vaginalis TaxID=2702 RepID=UPI00397085B1